MKQVDDLRHLIKCLRYMFFFSSVDRTKSPWTTALMPPNQYVLARWSYLSDDDDILQSHIDDIPRWEENFSRATYRLFTAAAGLCRAYHEPFFLQGGYGQFPDTTVYTHVPDQAKDAIIFGELSAWLLDGSREEAKSSGFVPRWKRPEFLNATAIIQANTPDQPPEAPDSDETKFGEF